MEFENVVWIHLDQEWAQCEVLRTVMNIRFLKSTWNFLPRWTTISFSIPNVVRTKRVSKQSL